MTMTITITPTPLCPVCVEAAEDGVGTLDPDYCRATDTVDIDGVSTRVCPQCAELVAENNAA